MRGSPWALLIKMSLSDPPSVMLIRCRLPLLTSVRPWLLVLLVRLSLLISCGCEDEVALLEEYSRTYVEMRADRAGRQAQMMPMLISALLQGLALPSVQY